jgi:hypothetical protein
MWVGPLERQLDIEPVQEHAYHAAGDRDYLAAKSCIGKVPESFFG